VAHGGVGGRLGRSADAGGTRAGRTGKPGRGIEHRASGQERHLTAIATNWIGDFYFYQGDYTNAREQYDSALKIAAKTPDRETTLLLEVNRAKADLALGHANAVIPEFRKLVQDADKLD